MGSSPASTETPVKPTVPPAYEPVLGALGQVKESLKAIVPPHANVLATTIDYSLGSGGKFLRPALTLLIAGASGKITPAHIEVAAVTELIHVATLLHDDVLDDSDLRRGRTTVKREWGNSISVLSGDYLLAQASLKLSKLDNCRLVAIYAQVLADLCDGEVIQMQTSYSLSESTWDTYNRKTYCKTASLFAAGCESATILNGLPETQIQLLRTMGHHFGLAFQIVDGLLDYTADSQALGKPVLDDLRNGLLNAPVLLALESDHLTEAGRQTLHAEIQQLFTAKGEGSLDTLQALIHEAQAIEASQALAQRYCDQALEAIRALPASPYQEALIQLTEAATYRKA